MTEGEVDVACFVTGSVERRDGKEKEGCLLRICCRAKRPWEWGDVGI